MKILIDMNIPLKYTELLSNKGIESIRWSTVGEPTATDDEIMQYARDNNFVVLTFDLDFGTILSTTHDSKPSVVQIRASVIHAERIVDFIAAALLHNVHELERGAILTIDANKARLRLLPL